MHHRRRDYSGHGEYMPPIMDWYYGMKAEGCLTCGIYGGIDDAKIEFHHLDRKTKYDEVSNMIKGKAPLDATLAEVLKCCPLCSTHHAQYHKCEFSRERYAIQTIKTTFDFTNEEYTAAIQEFHRNAYQTAPHTMRKAYKQFQRNKTDMFYQVTLGRSYQPGLRA